ncbi:MAG: hypothetical protein M3P08_17480 [Thermoproteota archaeon]|nr:hypothetical protein [Thermoproteota archaeon]
MIRARLASSKQHILNFVTAHPKVTTLLATLGITITFSLIGRLSLEHTHLAFAQGAAGKFPLDESIPLEKFPVDKVPKDTLATSLLATCGGCGEEPTGK